MKLVVQDCGGRVSQAVLDEQARSFLADPAVRLAPRLHVVDRGARAYGRLTQNLEPRRVRRHRGREGCLTLMMGPVGHAYLPQFLLAGRRSVYLYDAWPSTFATIERLARRWDVDDLFISASQAAEALAAAMPERQVVWIPEGIDSSVYKRRPISSAGTGRRPVRTKVR